MATTFKTPKNNAQSLVATAPSPSTTGTSLVVTTGEGTKFPSSNFWATIWNAATYAEPALDPSFEVVLVSARSTDTFTMTRGQLNGSSGRTVVAGDAIRLLIEDQHFIDIHAAVNALENTSYPKKMVDAVVAPSGGDYTDVPSAIAAGARLIGIKGMNPISASTTISTNGVTLVSWGDFGGTFQLTNTSNRLTFSGSDIRLIGIEFDVNSTTALASDTTGWVANSGSRNRFENCKFSLDGVSTGTTGVVLYDTGNDTVIRNNKFADGDKLSAHIRTVGNRTVIEGNEFENVSNMRCVWVDRAAEVYLYIRNNKFNVAAMADAKDIVYVRATSAAYFGRLQIHNNVFIPTGTFSQFTRNCVHVIGTSAAGSYVSNVSDIQVSGNTVACFLTNWGFVLESVDNPVVSNNVCGKITVYATYGAAITGNTAQLVDTSSSINVQATVSGNFLRTGWQLDSLRSSTVSNNVGDPGTGSYTLDSSSYGCVVSGNVGQDMNLNGNFHHVVGNAGYSSSSAEFSGTLTLAGTGHMLGGNRFATTTDTSTVPVTFRIKYPTLAKTAAYTVTVNDSLVTGDATSAAFTVTLPTAASAGIGRQYTVKKTDSSGNAVTVGTTSSQTIDGSTTYSLASQYKYVTVQSNGSNWYVIANN